MSVLVPGVQSTSGVTSNLAFALADNFIVTGPGWNVESLDFYGHQTGAVGFTFTNVTWSMRSGTDVNSAAIVASRTTAGNCFVTWSLAGSTASGPFVTPVLGTCDIGNGGLQSPNPGTFAPVVDGGTWETFDLPFAIQGNVMPEPATWALMPAGGVAVARMVRRRRA